MTVIFQDNKGEFSNFIDRSIEQIICIDGAYRHNTFTDVFLIWIKLKQEEYWYRIFLDAGCCFCSMYNSSEFAENYQEDLENCEYCPIYPIHRLYSLQGSTIVSASVNPINVSSRIDIYGVELKIVFDRHNCLLFQSDSVNSQSNLLITKLPI